MKIRTIILNTMAVSLFAVAPLSAQPFEEDGPPPMPPGSEGEGFRSVYDGDRGPGPRHGKGKFKGGHRKGKGQWLKKIAPEVTDKLETLKKEDPEMFRNVVRKLHKNKIRKDLGRALKSRNKEIIQIAKDYFNTELDSLILAEKYKKADTDQQAGLENDIRDSLEKSFGLKEKLQHLQVEQMQKRIAKLEEMMTKRSEYKSKIIEERFSEITGASDSLNW